MLRNWGELEACAPTSLSSWFRITIIAMYVCMYVLKMHVQYIVSVCRKYVCHGVKLYSEIVMYIPCSSLQQWTSQCSQVSGE